MRSKEVVPVGQGCKRDRKPSHLHSTSTKGKCVCHPDLYINLCQGCHEWFHTIAPHTKTCSDKCRKRLSRSRHDKLFQTVMSFANGQ